MFIAAGQSALSPTSAHFADVLVVGSVEATCKTIVTVRLKRAGARWRRPTAQATLDLRALATSSRWNDALCRLGARWPKDVRMVA